MPYPADKAFDGLVQVLARGLPELTAHSAYSGLFGYFIGLSVLRPGMAVFLIPFGWLSAAALHGACDATSDLIDSAVVSAPIHVVIGLLIISYLATAIREGCHVVTAKALSEPRQIYRRGSTMEARDRR